MSYFDTFDPLNPIPNNPFFYPLSWDMATPSGGLIFGAGFTISAVPGTVSVAQLPPPVIGTVTSVTAGTGIQTTPVTGITVNGSVLLKSKPSSLTPGAYTYSTIIVDAFGKLTFASNGVTPVLSVEGEFPVIVTGAIPTFSVDILSASVIQPGVTQLADDLVTQSTTEALTAKQGYILQQDINGIPIPPVEGQFYAGTFSVTTQRMQSVTTQGSGAGFTVGSSLPFPGGTAVEGFVVCTTAGVFSPPGGGGPYNVKAGDRLYCGISSWLYLSKTLNYPYATTTTSGLVQLATTTSVQGLTNTTLVCTPASLSNLNGSTTARGWIKLATDVETQTLLSPLKAVTPANLNALPATVFGKGIIQLNSSTTSTSVTTSVTSAALNLVLTSAILKSQIVATGDLIVGLSAGVPGTLPRGTNQFELTCDDGESSGLAWKVFNPPQASPIGTIFWFATNNALKIPSNFVVCNGGTASAAQELSPGVPNPYYDLFEVIGYTFGGSGALFNLPDLRGKFIRGWSGSGGVAGLIDNPRIFGSDQSSSVETHTHPVQSLTHTHNITITEPFQGHNHIATGATVIGPGTGYFGNKDTGPEFLSSGDAFPTSQGLSFTLNNGLSNPIDTIFNSAPSPVDQTRVVNSPMVPIIKFTGGVGFVPPTPPQGEYYVTSTPTTAGVSTVITTNILTVNVPREEIVYWELSGPGVTASLFSPAVLTGSVTIGRGNAASFTVTTAATFPSPPYTLAIKLYEDATLLVPVGNTSFVTLT